MSGQQEKGHCFRGRVYLEDVDQGGIVYHANYLKYAERARTEMLAAGGQRHADMMAMGGGIVVKTLTIDYQRPLRLEEDFTVVTQVKAMGAATAELEQRVEKAGELMALLNVTLVCLNAAGRPTRWPEAVAKALGA